MKSSKGKVYLVGAGPGDPHLITVKGRELLQRASVVFYDNLVHPRLLELAPHKAKRVYVGKRGEGSKTDQEDIENQLVAASRRFKTVVRLKGGDPFVFGRGGEEAVRLVQEKIPYEIVPGVSSTTAVAAYAGIPLTHRQFSSTVTLVTGRLQENAPPLDWSALSKMDTLVFVMGVKSLRQNMESLLQAGMAPETPVAVIRWGTYPRQKTWMSTVAKVADVVEAAGLMPPAVVIVGEVVRLREKLQWYEQLPLFGKRILVTRPRGQSEQLVKRLQALGAELIELPAIACRPPRSWQALDACLKRLSRSKTKRPAYDWLVFTSANAISVFLSRLFSRKKDLRDLAGIRIAVVGEASAAELLKRGLRADLVPKTFNSEALIRAFQKQTLKGKRILFPRAKEGREELIHFFREKGAVLHAPLTYETRVPRHFNKGLQALLQKKETPDLLTFTSSSSVKHLAKAAQQALDFFLQLPTCCIGPNTAQTARELGFTQVRWAKKATVEALVESILEFFIRPE